MSIYIKNLFNYFPKKVMLVAILAVLLVQLPTLYAWVITPDDYWFTGFSEYLNNIDVPTYVATMRLGREGSWLWENRFYSTSGKYPIFTFYVLLGHLSRIMKLPIPIVFHTSAFFLGMILILLVWKLLKKFLPDDRYCWFTFLLIIFGGGIGFVLPMKSLDTTHMEATFFASLSSPHFILDGILFLTTILSGFRAVTHQSLKWAVAAAVAGFLLTTIHPYSLFVVVLVLTSFTALSAIKNRNTFRRFLYLAPLILTATVTAVIYYKLLYCDPVLMSWMRQQIILSPPIYQFFLSYGLLMVLAFIGSFTATHNFTEENLLLLSWGAMHLSVIYLPVRFQYLMSKNLFIIIAILAGIGAKRINLLENARTKIPLLAILFLTAVYILFSRFLMVRTDNYFTYLPNGVKSAMGWIETNTDKESTILSDLITGNQIPALTGRRVFLGYPAFTPNFHEEAELAENFFACRIMADVAESYLRSRKITHIFYGPRERKEGRNDLRECYSKLSEIYRDGGVQILAVD